MSEVDTSSGLTIWGWFVLGLFGVIGAMIAEGIFRVFARICGDAPAHRSWFEAWVCRPTMFSLFWLVVIVMSGPAGLGISILVTAFFLLCVSSIGFLKGMERLYNSSKARGHLWDLYRKR